MAARIKINQPTSKDWNDTLNGLQDGSIIAVYQKGTEILICKNETGKPDDLSSYQLLSKENINDILAKTSEKTARVVVGTSSHLEIAKHIQNSQLNRQRILDQKREEMWVTTFLDFKKAFEQFIQCEPKDKEIFLKQYTHLGILEADLNFSSPTQNNFIQERALCVAFNKCKNDFELRQFIKTRKDIISTFAPVTHRECTLDQFELDIAYTRDETHNGGQLPAKVIFKIAKEEIFSIMYKPRSAQVDIEVQKVLESMGQPFLTIISDDNENKSIWQYINGEDMMLSEEIRKNLLTAEDVNSDCVNSPEKFIRHTFKQNENKQKQLLEKLATLNDIFLCLHISDLHGKNMRLTDEGDIYAIDLEVIDSQQTTLLMEDNSSDNSEAALIKARKDALIKIKKQYPNNEAIKIFKQMVGVDASKFKVPVRNVLLTTGVFREIRLIQEPSEWANAASEDIIEALKNKNFIPCSKELILDHIYKNILNGDVPFFTEYQNKVYYGRVSDDIVIGEKKK